MDQPLAGAWIDVHKRLWRRGGVEICRLEIEAAQWWTVAVPGRRPTKPVGKVLGAWAPLLRAGEAVSFPMWVLARWSEDLADPVELAGQVRDEAS